MKMTRRKKQRCPRCGHIYYDVATGRKRIVKIWMSEYFEEIWVNFTQNHETKEQAFEELLKKAGLITEKTRAYVEGPAKS